MSGEKDFSLAELIGDGDDVGNELRHGIRRDADGFAAEVVPALVGHDDAKTCSRQRLDLSVPRIPEFRKAVEQNDEGAIFRASSDRVQADIAILEGEVFHGAFAFRAVQL